MKINQLKAIQIMAGITLLIILFMLASISDFEEELAQQKQYCEMVESGAWPDYRENYEEMCK